MPQRHANLGMAGTQAAAACRATALLHVLPAVAAQQLGSRGRRTIAWTPRRRAARSCTMAAAAAGGDSAAAAAAAAPQPLAPAALWQRIAERYDAAQRDAAATMTETNTGAHCRLPRHRPPKVERALGVRL